MTLHHEVKGSGPTVVFLHPGIADSRVWDPQWASFADRYRLVRCDLPGFGRTPLAELNVGFAQDVVALLDELEVSAAAIVGCSFGGGIALQIAVARPDLVGALVLVGAGLPNESPSEALVEFDAAETEAVERGDLEAATELNMRLWVDGPRRRPDEVDPSMRAAVSEMQRNALEQFAPHWDDPSPPPLVDGLADRIGEVRVPTLILVGEEDVEDIHRFADVIEKAIPGSRRAAIADAAHVPNLEQPAAFDALVLAFLAEVL